MRIVLFAFFILQVVFSQETKYIATNYEFKNGEIAYMFGNDVKLRDQPTTNSNVLSLLKIGEQVEILEKSNTTMEFDGMDAPWYKVKANNKVGYVLGSFISLDKKTVNNLTYLIALKKDDSRVFLKTRIIKNGSDYVENESQLMTEEFSIKASGNKGLDNVKSILEIKYLAEACGINGGGIYLFYDGIKLVKAMDYSRIADADLYWFDEEYIFPEEKNGIKGKIVYKRESGETKEYETEWTETKMIRRVLEWNGKEIFPNIRDTDE
ncbi:SH3 domain-containing protein [Aquimarina litoralis]|uniref:SH3 domain-containing protein n=1 Tax=Aquimarina litoralis TaxID=584605 RepID=UPI001C5A28D4|nr:SH3 domain-containing protein [Aquimarina litoralis]MBW1294749.1 SH3 domain-containing protein [Aquimarina litoralis]